MKYIIQHGPGDVAWYVQAPQAWTSDKRKATRFDNPDDALAALDHLIAVRYPSAMFTKKLIKALRSKCRAVGVEA